MIRTTLITIIWMQTLCTILCAQATVYPDTLFFGRVRVGTHLVDTIRVQNPAAQDLLVDSVRMEGDGFGFAAAPFSGSVLVLSPQAEVRLLVRFSPVDTVEYVGEVQLSAEGGNLVVPVSGEGRREVVVINEILADPGSGEAGDANGDGTRHSSEDEFVELLNTGLRPFDLSGIQLSDAGTSEEKRFTFPPGTRIFGGERVVLFGGGSPQGVPGQVFADDGKIGGGLSNSGDAIFLIDPAGPDTLAKAAYGAEGGKNEALVREPEGTGNLVRHAFFPGNGTAFSPGRARVRATGALVVPVDTTIELGAVVIPSVWMDYSDGARKEVAENLEWSFSDTSVLRLHEGSFIATGVGECDVRVIVNGTEWGTVRFTVSAPGITDLQLSPSDTLVVVGAAHVFRVHGRYSDGGTTSIDGGLAWATSDTGVAVVETGQMIARGPGASVVTASIGNVAGSAVVRVADSGDLNADGVFDLVDALRIVHLILEIPPEPTGFEWRASDLNLDGLTDILDLAQLIRRMLGKPEVAQRVAHQEPGTWELEENRLLVQSPVPIFAMEIALAGTLERIDLSADIDASVRSAPGQDGKMRVLLFRFSEEALRQEMAFHISPPAAQITGIDIWGVDGGGGRVLFEERDRVLGEVRLEQNRPNPFNATTVLRYELPGDAEVDLKIFSCLGQEVKALDGGPKQAGVHEVHWDGRDREGHAAGSGMYLARLVTGQTGAVIKMVLLR